MLQFSLWRTFWRNRRLRRTARRLLDELFDRPDLRQISSLRPDHRSRALFLGCEAEGDTVVLFTDGVTEVFSPDGEMFGEVRLQQLVEQLAHRPPVEIVHEIRAALVSHAGSKIFRDDLTLVALRVRTPEDQVATVAAGTSLHIKRDLAELAKVREAISAFLSQSFAGSGHAFVGRVQLAVQEALTNILRHTEGSTPDDDVEIQIRTKGSGVAISLLYDGVEPFSPTEARLPEVGDYPTGGFGLYLIQESVESFEYGQSSDGRMRVLLYASPSDDRDTAS